MCLGPLRDCLVPCFGQIYIDRKLRIENLRLGFLLLALQISFVVWWFNDFVGQQRWLYFFGREVRAIQKRPSESTHLSSQFFSLSY